MQVFFRIIQDRNMTLEERADIMENGSIQV